MDQKTKIKMPLRMHLPPARDCSAEQSPPAQCHPCSTRSCGGKKWNGRKEKGKLNMKI